MNEFTLETELRVPRPRAEVFAFFAEARNLETITPPWLRFEVLTPPPIEMRAGTLIDYRIRVHGLPIRRRIRLQARVIPEPGDLAGRSVVEQVLPDLLWLARRLHRLLQENLCCYRINCTRSNGEGFRHRNDFQSKRARNQLWRDGGLFRSPVTEGDSDVQLFARLFGAQW